MSSAYSVPTDGIYPIVDYSGYSNMAMFVRWQNLSKTAGDASTIVNLIWTDLAASAVVGTKDILGPGNTGSADDIVQIAVQPIVSRIKYRYLFAIPAYVLIAAILIIISIAFLTLVFGRSNLEIMRRHLYHSSAGRVLTVFLYPEDCNMKTTSKEWSQAVGTRDIDLSNERPATASTTALGMEDPSTAPGVEDPSTAPGVEDPATAPGVEDPATATGVEDPATAPGVEDPSTAPGMEDPSTPTSMDNLASVASSGPCEP
jgi:hypothetical protein